MNSILLQCKFILVVFLNFTYDLIPLFLRRYYLYFLGIHFDSTSCIHRRCKFFHIGNLSIGKNSTINFGCFLDNRRGIYIGNNVGIAHNTKIYTLGHDLNDPMFRTKGASVHIEDNVFIFSNCLIMPGVRIKEGAIILAGSVVTKDVEPYTINGGNPIRKIKTRMSNINYNCKYRYLFAL
jgi:maltose O-acetyltransferase